MTARLKTISCAAFRNVYVLVTLVLAVGFLPALIIKGDLYFNSDWISQQIPFIAEMKRLLESGHPFWSWNTYFGADFIGSYAFYTSTSPFAWALCLLPYDMILPGSVVMMWIKLLTCAFFTLHYLRKMRFAPLWAEAGTLMYVFSSFTFLTMIFYHFVEPMIMFPLVLLAIEKFLRGENYSASLLALAIGATIIINFYFSIGTLSVAALYFLLRLRSCKTKTRLAIKAAVCATLGICLGAVALVPAALVLLGNARIDSAGSSVLELNLLQHINYVAVKIYSLLVPRLSDFPRFLNFSPVNFASVAAYLPVVGILPAFLFLRTSVRSWIGILTVVLLLLYITPAGAAFVLFTNAYYSRWAYCLVLILIVASLQYFKDGGQLNGAKHFCLLTLGLLVANFSVAYIRFGEQFSREGIFIALQIAVVIVNLACLLAFARTTRASILAGMVCVSAICFSWAFCAHRYFEWRDSWYAGAASESPNYRHLDRGADNFTHRTEILFHGGQSFCNSLLYSGYPGLTQYNSMSPGHLGHLMHTSFGHPGDPCFVPEYNRLSFAALMGVKEYIWVKPSPESQPLTCRDFEMLSLSSRSAIHDVYTYKYWLPIGFAVDHYTLSPHMEPYLHCDPMPDIPKSMISSIVIAPSDEAALAPYLSPSTPDFDTPLDSVVASARAAGCTEIKADVTGLYASVFFPRPRVIFFSIPSVIGMEASINGEKAKIYNANFGLSAIIAPAGPAIIRFEYRPVGFLVGAAVAGCAAIVIIIIFFGERKTRKTLPT